MRNRSDRSQFRCGSNEDATSNGQQTTTISEKATTPEETSILCLLLLKRKKEKERKRKKERNPDRYQERERERERKGRKGD